MTETIDADDCAVLLRWYVSRHLLAQYWRLMAQATPLTFSNVRRPPRPSMPSSSS